MHLCKVWHLSYCDKFSIHKTTSSTNFFVPYNIYEEVEYVWLWGFCKWYFVSKIVQVIEKNFWKIANLLVNSLLKSQWTVRTSFENYENHNTQPIFDQNSVQPKFYILQIPYTQLQTVFNLDPFDQSLLTKGHST